MAWTTEQLQAIEESGHHILVSAGAGSGKTAVLTTRVMEKVKHHIHVNELLILTFTNAAAAEMKERIRKNLIKEGNQEEIALLDSSYITTFDSFSLSLVKKYHYLLNLPKQIHITDSSIIALEKKKILDEVLEHYYQKEEEDFVSLIDSLCTKNDEKFREDFLNLAQKLEIRSDLEEYLSSYIMKHYSNEMQDFILKRYEEILREKCEDVFYSLEMHEADFEQDYYSKIGSALESLKNAPSLDDLLSILKCSKIPPVPRGSDEEIKAAKEEINNTLKEVQKLASYHNQEEIRKEILETQKFASVLVSLLGNYFRALKSYKKEKMLFDFGDIAQLSLELIQTHEEILQSLRNQFKEIMVDEYQDTSDLQEEFISLISNHNLYMVGDIKQSIYRFRNANPSIFKDKYEKFSKGEDGNKIDLLKNFRSRKEVLEDINLIFNPIMDLSIGEAAYKETHQMVFGNQVYEEQGYTIENHHMEILNYTLEEKSYSKEEVEFFTIAQDIQKKIHCGYQVLDKDSMELRPCTFKDFCLILDRNSSFDLAKKIFSYFDIPLSLYKDEELNQSYDMAIFYHLFSFLVHIYQKKYDREFSYAYVGLARSFLYRRPDEEIYETVTQNKIFESQIYQDFLELVKEMSSMSIESIFYSILETTHFYEKLILKGDVKDTLKRVDKVLELAQNVDHLSYGVEKFYLFLKELLNQNEVIKISQETTLENYVKMMNIHKSKGLEFPICYFCGLYKSFSRQDYLGDFLYQTGLPISIPVFHEGIKETILKLLIKEELSSKDVSEKIRLFYVALTRAREKMIFLLPKKEGLVEKKDENDVVIHSIRNHYHSIADMLYSIPKQIHPFCREIDLDALHLTKDYLLPKEKNFDFQEITSLSISPFDVQVVKKDQKHFSKATLSVPSLEERRNMDFGTLFHQTLENLDLKNFDSSLIASDFIRDKITQMLSHPLFLNLKDASIYQEYEFIYQDEKEEYHGQIDLMLEYIDHIDLIDYKLSEIEEDAYMEQLQGYQHYLERITSKQISLYLYSILSSQIKKIG